MEECSSTDHVPGWAALDVGMHDWCVMSYQGSLPFQCFWANPVLLGKHYSMLECNIGHQQDALSLLTLTSCNLLPELVSVSERLKGFVPFGLLIAFTSSKP
jgi:hypothetical protein